MKVETRTVARDIGRILQAVSLMLVVSLGVGIVNGEFYAAPAFGLSALIIAGIGTGLARRYQEAEPPGKLEGMVTAATAWAATGVLGALPFLLIAWTISVDPYPVWANVPSVDATTAKFEAPLNAVFESMSGFTGTGLTMAPVEEELPRSLHWWRSFTEWVGGVGVIVLTVAILARPGSGSFTLYEGKLARRRSIRVSSRRCRRYGRSISASRSARSCSFSSLGCRCGTRSITR